MFYTDKQLNELIETYPDDEAKMPLSKDGSIDYKAVKNLPKKTREEKIIYCALCNKIFGTYTFVTFSKLNDEKLQNQVESYELLFPTSMDEPIRTKKRNGNFVSLLSILSRGIRYVSRK